MVQMQNWQDLKWEELARCTLPDSYAEEFLEFAFAAIDDKLTAYVNGREILKFADPGLSQPTGTARVGVCFARGLFRAIEVQSLDKPTMRTPPIR